MAKLSKSEFNHQNKSLVTPSEASDRDKKALITLIYNWQQNGNIYAWDEESLHEDLGLSINRFTIAGENKNKLYIEVEFFQPLDEEVINEGVAFDYRLIKLQDSFYTLQKYRKPHKSEDVEIPEVKETEE